MGVQVLAGLQYSLPAPDMGGLTQQQTQWVLAALAAQGQQQLLPSVSAALALTHTNPAAAAGLFSHFPNSQLQVPSPLHSHNAPNAGDAGGPCARATPGAVELRICLCSYVREKVVS